MSSPLVLLPPEILAAVARGWRLLPVTARAKKPPLLRDWPSKASHDLAQIAAWANRFPGGNWAMATGPGSNVFVLDIDGDKGQGTCLAHRELGRELPPTLTVTTGNGIHLFFCWPKNQVVRTSAGTLAPGWDIRGDGGYVVIPPSIHPSGVPYAYLDPRQSIADAPAWLREMIAGSESQTSRTLATEFDILREGRRNDGLTRLGGGSRRRGGELPELEASLLEANVRRCRPPLPDVEVRTIAASVARYAVGGPDPLDSAWMQVDPYLVGYEKFVALVRELQASRPGLSIALPLVRIGTLMRRDWTLVRRWRARSVREGLLEKVAEYIPHKKASLYILTASPTKEAQRPVPLGASVPLKEPTNGLVGRQIPSGTCPVVSDDDYLEGWL